MIKAFFKRRVRVELAGVPVPADALERRVLSSRIQTP